MISPRINQFRIFPAPKFKAALLFMTTDPGFSATSVNGRLKVIGQSQDKVNRPTRNAARESLPPIGGQDSRDIGKLAKKAHPLVPFPWPMLFICFVSSLFRSRFSSTNRDRNLGHPQVFQSHVFKPAEYLLVGMFGLIPGRVPIKGIQKARSWIRLTVHRKHMMDRPRDRFAYPRHRSQATIEVVKNRDRNFQHAVESLGMHSVGVLAPKIAEAIPLVVAAVEPHRERAARLQITG